MRALTLECRLVSGNCSAVLSGSIVIKDPNNPEPKPASDCFSFASPIVEIRYHYWFSKHHTEQLPSRGVEPPDISDLLPHIILLDVEADPHDFRYRLIGTGITKTLECNLTGAWMLEIPFQMPPSTTGTTAPNSITRVDRGNPTYPKSGRTKSS